MIQRMVPTFAEGAAGEAVGMIGSSGFLEISVNKGNAARTLGAARGSEVDNRGPGKRRPTRNSCCSFLSR